MKQYFVIFTCGLLIISNNICSSSKNDGWEKEDVNIIINDTKNTLKTNMEDAKNVQKRNNRRGSGKIQPVNKSTDDMNGIKLDETQEEIRNMPRDQIIVVEEENQQICPFQKYDYVFLTRWSPKSIALNEFQHTSLGAKNYLSSDHTKAEYYIKNIAEDLKKCPDNINGKTNLSVLRSVTKAINYALLKNDFGSIRTLLKLCSLNGVDFWTSPSIDKDTVERNKNDNNLTASTSNLVNEKNKVQSFFKATRKNLFNLIHQQIESFIKNVNPEVIDIKKISNNQSIILPDAIDKIKELYILTVMAYNIHEKKFLNYEDIAQEFKDISEKNVLNLVAPDKVPYIEQIKMIFANVKKASEDTERAKKTLLSATKNNNIEESILPFNKNL